MKLYLKLIVAAALFAAVVSPASLYAQIDRDLDNDGWTDARFGGIDKDSDNDGWTDSRHGGIDKDLDNDGWNDQR